MAQKRMFDKAVIDTDKFMDLPVSTKALYFLLGMEADDEGFVSYKKVIRIHGGTEDDIKVLEVKNFVIMFKSGVVVITDWRKNNWLDSRRIKQTEYTTEKEFLAITRDNQYMLSGCLADAKPEEYRVEEYRVDEYRVDDSKRMERKASHKKPQTKDNSELSSQVNKIMDIFSKINPSLNWGNKTTRGACEWLIKKYTLTGAIAMSQAVIEVQGKLYAPVATTPYQMKEKLAQFRIYFDNQKNNKPKIEKYDPNTNYA